MDHAACTNSTAFCAVLGITFCPAGFIALLLGNWALCHVSCGVPEWVWPRAAAVLKPTELGEFARHPSRLLGFGFAVSGACSAACSGAVVPAVTAMSGLVQTAAGTSW
jgi:hypothetical protein